MGILEKIQDIEFEAKLAKLRTQLQEPAKSGGGGGEGFEVQKYGDGRVALIGFPSVGESQCARQEPDATCTWSLPQGHASCKSTLLTMLTGTKSEAAAYEFTTLTCIPGVIHYNDAKIQLLDLPGIIEGAAQGKGRGRQVIAVCKSADLLLMVLDAGKPHYHREILTRELESVGIRLNRGPPAIYFKKARTRRRNEEECRRGAAKKTGGIAVNSMLPLTHLDDRMISRVLQEYKIHNCDLLFKEDSTVDDLIDVIEGNRRYMRCLYVYNKVDVCSMEEVDEIARRPYSIPVSCFHDLNMGGLLSRIWSMMGLVRVYTKKAGHRPDFAEPVVLSEDRGGTTVQHFCEMIHKSLLRDFKYALVWGTSTKHMPQRCGLSHQLEDEDVVQASNGKGRLVKKKVTEEDGKGRFKQQAAAYVKTTDREKKKPLKT
eukprot:scaffold3.g6467.t1